MALATEVSQLAQLADRTVYAMMRDTKANPTEALRVDVFAAWPVIFGDRYVKYTASQLSREDQAVVLKAQYAYRELRDREGIPYHSASFEKTKELTYCFSSARNKKKLVHFFRARAWDSLPFLLFQTRSPDKEMQKIIKRIRMERSLALGVLNKLFQGGDEEPTGDEKLRVWKLLCTGGALIDAHGKSVYFLDLLPRWGGQEAVDKIREKLGIVRWFPSQVDAYEKIPPGAPDVPFPQFVIDSTVTWMEQSIGFLFQPPLKKYLKGICEDERTRSDLICFLAYRERARGQDWSKIDENSKRYLTALQTYFSLVEYNQVKEETKPILLEICLHKKVVEKAPGELKGDLEGALEATLKLAADPQNPDTYSLFSFFFTLPLARRGLFLGFFNALKELPEIGLTPSIINHFCRANTEVGAQILPLLQSVLREVIARLKEENKPVTGVEALFLNPPIVLNGHSVHIGETINRTDRFLSHIKAYEFKFEAPFFGMLREFILKPSPLVFGLLEKDGPALGIQKKDEAFFARVLAQGAQFAHSPVEFEIAQAKEWVMGLSTCYSFSEADRFSLYLEAIRVVSEKGGSLAPFRVISKFIFELKKHLGLVLPTQVLYYLYRHHPIAVFAPEYLASLRAELIEKTGNDFRIDQTIHSILASIHQKWSEVFNDARFEEKEQVVTLCEKCTLRVIVPPLQPLVDFLRTTGVSDTEIRWASPHLEAHDGQWKEVPGTDRLGVHFSWHLSRKNFPVLSIAVASPSKRRADTTTVTLEISQKEISQERRGAIFCALFEISQQLLCSEEPQDERIKVDLNEDEALLIKNFVREAKISYRRVYWEALTTDGEGRSSGLSLIRASAQGQIFPPGALIPEYLFKEQLHPEFYSARSESTDISPLIETIKQVPIGRTPLKISLTVTEDEQKLIKLPLYIRVHTAAQIRKEDKHWDERAPDLETVQGSYVTLSLDHGSKELKSLLLYSPEVLARAEQFREFWIFQVLRLKARWYHELAPQRARASSWLQSMTLGARALTEEKGALQEDGLP